MLESCSGAAWVLLGCCLGAAWVLLGCCLGAAWALRGKLLAFCCLSADCVGAAWVLYGSCLEASSGTARVPLRYRSSAQPAVRRESGAVRNRRLACLRLTAFANAALPPNKHCDSASSRWKVGAPKRLTQARPASAIGVRARGGQGVTADSHLHACSPRCEPPEDSGPHWIFSHPRTGTRVGS